MKKILSIIAAGTLALLAISCAKDEKATFDSTKATAPVLEMGSAGKTIKVQYTPAVIEMSFNENMKVYHTLGLVGIGQKDENDEVVYKDVNVTLSAAKDDPEKHVISLASDALTTTLQARGFDYGDEVWALIVVRASIQDPSKGVTNGYVDSDVRYEFYFKLKKPSGGAYASYTEDSAWSVIGSIASTGNSWNADEAMMSNGTWHVCEGLELTTSDEFKFRKDASWGTNFGGDFVMLDSEFAVTQDGPNIKVKEDGVYDLLLNPDAGVAKIVVHKEDPYAKYNQESPWSVIGSIASTGNSWGSDEEMASDGTWHLCRSLELTTSDEFKFRKDASWGTNFGGEFVALGEEFAVTQDGPNIKVLEDGTYDLYLNPEAAVAKIVKAGVIEEDKPEPEPEPQGTSITIDGDPADWAEIEGVTCAEGAELTGMKSAKAYYSDKIYVLVEFTDEALATGHSSGKLRFHVFFGFEGAEGLDRYWDPADITYMFEGKVTDSSSYINFSSPYYKWLEGWSWDNSGVTPTFECAGSGNFYEMSIDYSTFPGGLADTFSIGFDCADGNYNVIGYLPNAAEGNAAKITLTKAE